MHALCTSPQFATLMPFRVLCPLAAGRGACESEVGEEAEDPASAAHPHCVICIEGFDPKEYVRELPGCGHVFHKRCIDLWLRGEHLQQAEAYTSQNRRAGGDVAWFVSRIPW